jgi:DNA-binding NtrC family response regulator
MSEQLAGSVRIALAEDEPDLRKAFVALLEVLGHKVVCAASNGAELLDACFTQEVDLAVVDLDMPIVDGPTAAEEISEKGIPVIIVSGHPDVKEIVLEHEPVVTRIVKPATLESLRRAISEALATRDA